MGVDNIPAEALKNDHVIAVIHKLCNMFYRSRKVPNVWANLLYVQYQNVQSVSPATHYPTEATGAYKVYCTLLNNRVTSWCEHKKLIFEGQNGFRRGRSTTDYLHLSSLTNIIETRKKMKTSTFCAFICFKKHTIQLTGKYYGKNLINLASVALY